MSIDFQLPAGVHVLERGWLSANNILFVGERETALVDSGYVSHAPQTLALVAQLLTGRPLDRLLNTHLHSDHCGGNAALQASYPALRTAIPPGEAQAVCDWDMDRLSYRATGQECPRFSFDDLLVPGRDVELGARQWEVHAAPGHDPHAIMLFDPSSGVLVSGDALWEKGFGVVFPEMWGEPSFDQVAATLDLIESLHPRCVIPGHGGVFGQVPLALETARNRLESFVQSPFKHAKHAMKVLIKFKLLDARQLQPSELDAWLVNAGYMELVRRRFAPERSLSDWSRELVGELVKAGAARIERGSIHDA